MHLRTKRLRTVPEKFDKSEHHCINRKSRRFTSHSYAFILPFALQKAHYQSTQSQPHSIKLPVNSILKRGANARKRKAADSSSGGLTSLELSAIELRRCVESLEPSRRKFEATSVPSTSIQSTNTTSNALESEMQLLMKHVSEVERKSIEKRGRLHKEVGEVEIEKKKLEEQLKQAVDKLATLKKQLQDAEQKGSEIETWKRKGAEMTVDSID